MKFEITVTGFFKFDESQQSQQVVYKNRDTCKMIEESILVRILGKKNNKELKLRTN